GVRRRRAWRAQPRAGARLARAVDEQDRACGQGARRAVPSRRHRRRALRALPRAGPRAPAFGPAEVGLLSAEAGPTMSKTGTKAATGSTRAGRNVVGISFMASPDTEAIIDVTRRKYPDARIDFRDCFYKVEREKLLDWSMDEVGEQLGRPYDTDL